MKHFANYSTAIRESSSKHRRWLERTYSDTFMHVSNSSLRSASYETLLNMPFNLSFYQSGV